MIVPNLFSILEEVPRPLYATLNTIVYSQHVYSAHSANMAEPTPLKHATNALRTTIGLPVALTNYVANEPLVTGPLLWALTRGPPNLRERLLSPLRANTPDALKHYIGPTSDVRLAKIVSVLKILFALGVVKRVSNALNALAMNGWYLPGLKPMARWKWDGKTEVVVITGGCSGFGYEMVKQFAGKATVVVVDISELPAELEKCESTIECEKPRHC